MGISGEIRSNLIRYRSKKETGEDYFPRIESVRDNLGNIYLPNEIQLKSIQTKNILRPGDNLDFVVTASDPDGLELEYSLSDNEILGVGTWQKENNLNILIENKHIAKLKTFWIFIKSPREYHASSYVDDFAIFSYQILPKK